MYELLFLLLPIAAGYGWFMGERRAKQKYQDESYRLSREYVDGLNLILSNQQDKAVDLFLDLLKEDSGTVEAHLTLGNLFRSRGELDRAIRIHQTLMESASLTFEQRLLATQQLGRDYMSAGFYDRAEDVFSQLIDEEDFQKYALQQLIIIYQSTREWNKAITMAVKLVKLGQKNYTKEIAQFYCELAVLSTVTDDLSKSFSLLQKAIVIDPHCARASLMLGRLLIEQGEHLKAVGYLVEILKQDHSLLNEALPHIKICYEFLNQPEKLETFLKLCIQLHRCNAAELMLTDLIEQKKGRASAQLYLYRELNRHPNLKGFYRLMDYYLADAEEGRAKESLGLLKDMVGEQIKSIPSYCCERCGFTVNSIYWLCPSCRSWSTIKPSRDFIQSIHSHNRS